MQKGFPFIFLHDERVRAESPLVAGVDEAGRGPLAGPVVAASVILPSGVTIKDLRDSKKIKEIYRKRVFWEIVRKATAVGTGVVDAERIDEINIIQSTKHAMKTAVEDMGITPDIVLVDAVKINGLNVEQKAIIKGESVSASIAAASIVAKVLRDEIMYEYAGIYPEYNFGMHKGYCTREHMDCIQKYGPTPVHRKSFSGVKEVHSS